MGDTVETTDLTQSNCSTPATSQSSSSPLSSPTCTSFPKCLPPDSVVTSSSTSSESGKTSQPVAQPDPTQSAVSATTSHHPNPSAPCLATPFTPFSTSFLCLVLARSSQKLRLRSAE